MDEQAPRMRPRWDSRRVLVDLFNIPEPSDASCDEWTEKAKEFVSRYGALRVFPLPTIPDPTQIDPEVWAQSWAATVSTMFRQAWAANSESELGRLKINAILSLIFKPASISGKEESVGVKVDLLAGKVEP